MNKPIALIVTPLLGLGLSLLAGCGCTACHNAEKTQSAAEEGQPRARSLTGHEAKTPVDAPSPASVKTDSASVPPASSSVSSSEPAAEPAAQAKPPSFMIDEAKLPQGFPGPGPVGQVVVKTYPAARVALFAPDDNRSGDDMFMPLFRHIERNNVPMTAPVEMTFKPIPGEEKRFRSVSMAFVYPSTSTGKVGTDRDVVVQDVAPITVLSVGFRGGYGRSSFIEGYDKIQAFMSENPGKFKPAGPARLMAYNSPFVPFFLKYGEVQLPVEITSP